jgi:excisionase family DNA binding protein
MTDEEKLLRVAEAAEILQVHPQTLRDWERHGSIVAVRTPGGQRRFRLADVLALRDGGKP